MGVLKVEKLTKTEDKANFIHQLVKDIEALEVMIDNDLIEKSPIRIGAEQEFCLVDEEFLPTGNSLDVLSDIKDDHFTTEIGNFNLEINLDPIKLSGECFSAMHKDLIMLLSKANESAKKHNSRIILTGILPTLSLKHIDINNMTDVKRYYVLNDAIKESRKQDFDIHIKGVDELNLVHDSVMLEGCNTSFQMHLQINPDTFVQDYNWAQAIAGPILSACANSPMLFGKELWNETRIALFTQSVDTRANSFTLNEKQSRVSFGNEWSTGSITDIFKDNISRFRSLITSEFEKDSVTMLENGEIPKLKALNLHNGTVYRWNRTCYGVGNGKPHLRIENRYIPSGPTMADEIANFAFWVGVMKGRPRSLDDIHTKMDFKDAKSNFFSAARYGMGTQFFWNNTYIPASQLLLDELLPMAFKGLYSMGVSPKDAEHYLSIIENRIRSNNGAEWMIKSYRSLLQGQKPYKALQNLTAFMYDKQKHDYPVCTWNTTLSTSNALFEDRQTVKHVMNTDIFSVDENDSLELVISIMRWKNIHHMPIINTNRELTGLLTWTDVKAYKDNKIRLKGAVKEAMKKEVFTITQHESIERAQDIMKEKQINCLPVIKNNCLIGIVTSNDLPN